MARDATLIPMAAAAVPTQPASAAGAAGAAAAAAPVTAEEAEALARRIRVESKIPRLALVGTILGVVLGVAAIWPFTDSGGYMAETLLSSSVGLIAFAPGWLLAGLLPLVAFYAARLHFQSQNATTPELETSLRKIRRLIFWSMLASAAAFIGVVVNRSENRWSSVSGMPFLYVACFAACATIVRDVRRGLGDFDSEHQRRRRRLVRGFQVELVPAASPAAPLQVGDGNRNDADNDADDDADADIPLATAVALPPPLPVQQPPALPHRAFPVDFGRADEDEHSKDLRLLLALGIIAGICIHAARVGEVFAGLDGGAAVSYFEQVMMSSGVLGGFSLLLALNLLGAYLLVPCALLWILWGVSALNYGPGIRSAAVVLAVITLALSAAVVLPWWFFAVPEDALPAGFSAVAGRLARAPEIVHAALITLLLTRPGIKILFAKSSATGDEN